MKTRTRGGTILSAATAALLVLSTPALAAPGGGGGGGGGGGAGGGGGEDTTGSVYSDLVIALRAVDGTPILQKYVVPETAEVAASIEYCVQPVSYVPIPGVTTLTTNPVDGRTVYVVPLQGALLTATTVPPEFTGACDPQPQYAMYVSEVELERLNLARTADEVIATKLADVKTKLLIADKISLDATGRINLDGKAIDASPENAAIYQSLMKTGTIPGLPDSPTTDPVPPAEIGLTLTPPDLTSNSRFDAWELAAMNIGAAASKSTPLTLDAVEYYNRIIGFPPAADSTATPPVPEYVSPWGVSFVQSADPDTTDTVAPPAEKFVDYAGFEYNRSQTFKGSVTWLDVPTLTWKVSHITDVVPFTNLSSYDAIGTRTLTGITAFAQLADDVRALCNFVPDNTYLPGFYMDVPGVDTNAEQLKAIHDPAVDLGTLPVSVFQSYPFQMTASLLNPWGGDLIDTAQLRLRIHENDVAAAFEDGDVTAVSIVDSQNPTAQNVTFTLDGGDLVGTWGTSFPVAPGYNVSTTFNATVAAGAPEGTYDLTLELINVTAPTTILAQESGTMMVYANEATVLWGTPLPKLATQGVSMAIPLQVYSPADGTRQLVLTVTGPGDDLTTAQIEGTRAGDVKIYASNGADMVAMPLELNAEGQLVGTWDATLVAGDNIVTWYTTVAVGALVGNYAFGVRLVDGNELVPIVVSVSAPETHGEQPPDAGDDLTAPIVTVTPVGDLGSTATFTLTAKDDVSVTFLFECKLTKNGELAEDWTDCSSTPSTLSTTGTKTYTGLDQGDYVFYARATDEIGRVSFPVPKSWTVAGPDTTPPVVTITLAGDLVSVAAFTLDATETDVTYECMLTANGVAGAWESCTSPKTYTGLQSGSYTFSARATDAAKNVSPVEVYALVIPAAAPADTQAPATVPPTTSGSTGAAVQAPPAAGTPGAGAPSTTTPVVQAAVVKVKAINNGTKLFVNVNPNRGKGYWNIKVYRKVVKGTKVSWEKVGKTLRTKTSKETRTINLGKGTYRVKVMERYGMQGDVSKQVTLVR